MSSRNRASEHFFGSISGDRPSAASPSLVSSALYLMYVKSFCRCGAFLADHVPISRSSISPTRHLPKLRHRKSCSLRAANIRVEGMAAFEEEIHLLGGKIDFRIGARARAHGDEKHLVLPRRPVEVVRLQRCHEEGHEAGLLYVVMPPSTKTNSWSPTITFSG